MNFRKIKPYPTGKQKVAIIGVGHVGASIAYSLVIRELAREIILVDVDTKKAEAEALDIQHGIPYMGTAMVYAGDYRDCKDCDLIIIAAGRNRRHNETRLQMANDNSQIMYQVIKNLTVHYNKGVVMIVTNPVDPLVYQCSNWMGLQNGMVFGTGCMLDTSRLISTVASYANLKTEIVKGFVVGEHGDAQIPIWSRLSIAGAPIEEYYSNVGLPWGDEQKTIIATKIRQMGTEIIRGKGRTHYGIAICVCYLADAILNQRNTVASVSSSFQGEYGIENVALSVPSIIGSNGVERRLEENWTTAEIDNLHQSAKKLKKSIKKVEDLALRPITLDNKIISIQEYS